MQVPDLEFLLRLTAGPLPWLLALILVPILYRLAKALFGGGNSGEAQVARRLAKALPRVAHDLVLRDRQGALAEIDHVALTPAGLLVVTTENYPGLILGRIHERQWTQAIDGHHVRFPNPLRQNQTLIEAVQALGLEVPVQGLVVFTRCAGFPIGQPDGVVTLAEVNQRLAEFRQGRVPKDYRAAWDQLLREARKDPRTHAAAGGMATPAGTGAGPTTSARPVDAEPPPTSKLIPPRPLTSARSPAVRVRYAGPRWPWLLILLLLIAIGAAIAFVAVDPDRLIQMRQLIGR